MFAALALNAWALTAVAVEFETEWFLPSNSRVKRYFEIQEDYISSIGPEVCVYHFSCDAYDTRAFLARSGDILRADRYVSDRSIVRSWYERFVLQTGVDSTTERSAFVAALLAWQADDNK